MNRIGVLTTEAEKFIKTVQQCNFIDLKGIFSHLACAEDEKVSQIQIEKFKEITSKMGDLSRPPVPSWGQ